MVYMTGPTLAQDEGGGLRVSLGVQQSFGTSDNLSLGVPGSLANPEEGRTTLSTTDLALNVSSETRTQKFNFLIGGALRFGSIPSGSRVQTGFVDPAAALHYSIEAARARLSLDASYSESALSQSRPLWDFRDEDNVITPPSDLANLQGTGDRQASNFSFDYEAGIDAPIGFRLQATRDSVKYINATTAAPTDYDRANVKLSTYFRFSPGTAGVIDLSASRYNNNVVGTTEDSRSIGVGFDRELATGAMVSARVGYTDGDPNNTGGTAQSSSGVTGSLNYSQPTPNGSFGASYALTRNASGDVDTLSVQRSIILPTGSLAFNVGASSLQGGSPELIGGLSWQHQMPTSTISLSLDRRVQVDSNNDNVFVTSLAGQFRHQVNAQSSIFANVSYFLTDGSSTSNDVARTDLSMGYSYELTSDWDLNAGVNLTTRDETLVGSPLSPTLGKGTSNGVFVSLSRKFDLN